MAGMKLVNAFEDLWVLSRCRGRVPSGWDKGKKQDGLLQFPNGWGYLLLLLQNQCKLAAYSNRQPLEVILGFNVLIS